MTLIKCPECGKEISDKSDVCIYCGYPISKEASCNTYTVVLENCGNEKVKVIKNIRELNNMDLLPAKKNR